MSSPVRVILASASPRRTQLLDSAGLRFEVIPADIDEVVQPGLAPQQVAAGLAQAKTAAIANRYPDAIVIGADTIVVLGIDSANPEILGKPADRSEAAQMLSQLQGREHAVVTGYCIKHLAAGKETVSSVTSRVQFKALSPLEIEHYIDTGEPMDKAGSYGIQEVGAFLIREVRGSYTNVVGLPLAEVIDELANWGVWSPAMLPKAR